MYRHPGVPWVQADLGEVVAWRNTFWALSDRCVQKRRRGSTGLIYRIMLPANLSRTGTNGLREDQKHYRRNVTSGLIYLPSSARDLNNPRSTSIWRSMCAVRTVWITSTHQDPQTDVGCHWQRIWWSSELYEINYSGSQDEIRLQCLRRHKAPAIWTR